MIIKSAKLEDLPAIQYLMQIYGKMVVGPEHLNKRDIAVQARNDSGELIGFIWCGLMAKNTLAYVDSFVVHPTLAGKGVGTALLLELQKRLSRAGVVKVFGAIKQDEFHDKSAMNCLKMGMGADNTPHTIVFVELQKSLERTQHLGGL